ncbi:Glycine dehydrogenase (decarboxylating) [Sulfolobus islandicus Y.G.57.14]|jgi:glycine dehydrogenase subunit 2|uniref:Probable glycine dehydrogenase (decarboxylating) subunit 2 n=9 Tax=Saccharolobus islandicus TaxID=43080 RepID=GCSPB_SACI1|nr:aminomethyl-transferring glycine dehydrogenase subunit GcvPB [Sulfolobus islandicus]C3MPT6.1 RecName: Full=Probable glycine dehydrogenase (decarboxylating) subunit 2; AltName: Full=Glycine cleavage system P-protein subunit 2; AltName: Full=Glycine decarboxylase subunit 2; AltName: Full=Glycine dehydrogenase (aminomethyl-transferring) subunit 2 [Sulfolobus islandicus L.S.2.15]C3MUU9.1 RecName: Full=Probable glycine dehydrogenase (decarboxylating) subunit 2; AltName: Full=Glycine cleavage system
MVWRQAKWDEPLIFELNNSGANRQGLLINKDDEIRSEIKEMKIPKNLLRENGPNLPSLSELEVVRHFIRLSQMNFGVDVGIMPLGSCTMKYNPKIEEKATAITESHHPLEDEDHVQGILEMIYELQNWFSEITGMDECSLQVPAGSAGEFAGVLMIKKYHEDHNRNYKDTMLVADTAHGTNPASAAMAGYKVMYVKSNGEGLVDMDILREIVNDKTAGFMLTNPNTLGLFEENILEISKIIHSANAILYYDGANLNGVLGIARPGDMGFDIVHLNLHKTFAVPHGGGGPGAGAICAKGELVNYLPYPMVEKVNGKYRLSKIPKNSVGKIATFYGNVGNLARSFAYLLGLGPQGVQMVGKMSTLATNYLIAKLRDIKELELIAPNRHRKHEVVFSVKQLMENYGVSANDVAKALLDSGFYAPTIYFPPIIEEALMIEPTETESKETLDMFAEALKKIVEDAKRNPEQLLKSPSNTSIARLDQAYANHPSTITPTYRVLKLRRMGKINYLK